MAVVDNVRTLDQQKSKMTSVNIEQVDESWALKLLNECEMDEQESIALPKMSKASASLPAADLSHTPAEHEQDESICVEAYIKQQEVIESIGQQINSDSLDLHSIHIEVDEQDDYVLSEDVIDAALLSLSAIEIQKLALAEQQAKVNAQQHSGFWARLFR